MKRRDPGAYAFALARGAKVKRVQTALGPSFYVVWYPSDKKPQSTPVIVTLLIDLSGECRRIGSGVEG